MHVSRTGKVNLGNAYVKQVLGLQIGGIYSYDLYHAERHTSGSNFVLTTNVKSKVINANCALQNNGRVIYNWTMSSLAQDWKLIGGPSWGIINGDHLRLVSSDVRSSVGYAFLKQQFNLGSGFTITSVFRATPSKSGEGFVLMVQRDTLTNLNGTLFVHSFPGATETHIDDLKAVLVGIWDFETFKTH